MESLGFSIHKIMSFINKDSLTSSFPIWMPFISFSCLAAPARTSSTMLNRSGGSRHPLLVLDLKGKTFCFAPLSMVLTVGFSQMPFIRLKMFPSSPSLLNFVECFFCVY